VGDASRNYTDQDAISCAGIVTTWHLDEMFVSIGGKKMYLWRAVDAEGEVLDCLVQSRRNKQAALRLMRKLIRKYRMVPALARGRLDMGFLRV
jgi:transposase-like protein